MKSLKNLAGESLEQMIDYKVVDDHGDHIGSLHSLWSDPFSGAVEFLGVKTGWIFGQNHVVPAEKAELDEVNSVVRLPYTAAFIKEAPAMSAEAEISETEEQSIFEYYGLPAPTAELAAGSEGGADDESGGGTAQFATAAVREAAMAGLPTAGADEMAAEEAKFDKRPADPAGSRLRRTSRPPQTAAAAESADTVTDESLSQRMAMEEAAIAGGGGWAGPLGADFGGATVPVFPVAQNTIAASTAAPAEAETVTDTVTSQGRSLNADPISGEPGAHPVGTGVGAAGGGTAGAVIGGAIGGPIGAAVGGIAGAVGGGLAGKSLAEAVDPTAENAYWESAYQQAPYYDPEYGYSDYAAAYRVGYLGYGRYAEEGGGDYASAEPRLQEDYSREQGASKLGWDKAKGAVADAWNRVKARV